MKKVIFILINLLTVISLIVVFGMLSVKDSVEGGDDPTIKFTGEIEHDVTLYVLENDIATRNGYFRELKKDFEAAYSEYNITIRDALMDQYSDLELNGPYGYGPDVLYQANDLIMRYVDGKHIFPLPLDRLESIGLSSYGDTISEQSWNVYNRNISGTDYKFGIPVNVQAPVIYYRKDLLPDTDANNDGTIDILENWCNVYAYAKKHNRPLSNPGGEFITYLRSMSDAYFNVGYLYSYGGYSFGSNGTDDTDIGLHTGDAELGARVLMQLAEIMNEQCIDDEYRAAAYKDLADGRIAMTLTTPDVLQEFKNAFNSSRPKLSLDNLGIASMPAVPASGDLNDIDGEMIPAKIMGGVHAYCVSSYTKSPNAALAFANFATSKEMIAKRATMLGIAPARNDVTFETDPHLMEMTEVINENLKNESISFMPSIRSVNQLWIPLATLFQDFAQDVYRKGDAIKYYDTVNGVNIYNLQKIKEAIKNTSDSIYKEIHTLG